MNINPHYLVSACPDCMAYFEIDKDSKHVVVVFPGRDCDYCTDLTGRPSHVPPQGWERLVV